eukprot:1708415-Lingulodinium_polyedra.AAC.1
MAGCPRAHCRRAPHAGQGRLARAHGHGMALPPRRAPRPHGDQPVHAPQAHGPGDRALAMQAGGYA